MVSTTEAYQDLWLRSTRLQAHLAEAITEAGFELSVDEASQLSVTLADPEFEIATSGVLQIGARVNYQDLDFEIAAYGIGPGAAGTGGLSFTARPRGIQRLRARRGPLRMDGASMSQFVKAECRAVGLPSMVQPSVTLPFVKRNVADPKQAGAEIESSWTTFRDYADQLGYWCFESGGVLYFGKPSWLMQNVRPQVRAGWLGEREGSKMNNIPEGRRSADNPMEENELSFEVPFSRSKEFRPGRPCLISGVPYFSGWFIVKSVNFDLAGRDSVDVTVVTPRDPQPRRNNEMIGIGGPGWGYPVGGGKVPLRTLLAQGGFTGEELEVAFAIVMAESRARPDARGDVRLMDAKWGPSIGLFQIRSLKHPGIYPPPDNQRVESRLYDPLYNIRLAHRLSNGGRDWRLWSTWGSGAWREYYRKGLNPLVAVSALAGGFGTLVTGKSASEFVNHMLRQKGDRYRFGAEVRLSDPDPSEWDCSELIQWALHQVGITYPDGSSNQINASREISLTQAYRTRGALLWKEGHIAVSLGNEKTIEAANPFVGVVIYPAKDRGWTRAGLIPGLNYAK